MTSDLASEAAPLELRIAVREVHVATHSSTGWRAQRACKVYYREPKLLSSDAHVAEVHVPRSALQAVWDNLATWASQLPSSHARAPLRDNGGHSWQASHLSLPPKDGSGLE
eukprot:1643567-Amphidinium_carterae.1